ncbi:hypothetical protein [Serratia fonticola]
MFNKVEVNANDIHGATADLLINRKGEWFTFKEKGSDFSITIHTALVVNVTDYWITCIDGKKPRITKETHKELCEILKKYN